MNHPGNNYISIARFRQFLLLYINNHDRFMVTLQGVPKKPRHCEPQRSNPGLFAPIDRFLSGFAQSKLLAMTINWRFPIPTEICNYKSDFQGFYSKRVDFIIFYLASLLPFVLSE